MAHVAAHLDRLEDSVQYVCPAATYSGDSVHAICDQTTPLSKGKLARHLTESHGMVFTYKEVGKNRPPGAQTTRTVKGDDREEEILHDWKKPSDKVRDDDDVHDENEDRAQSVPRKKLKSNKQLTIRTPRQPLHGKDANQKVVSGVAEEM
jgi:hypothetical protein